MAMLARWVTRLAATLPVAAVTIIGTGIALGTPAIALLIAAVAVGLPSLIIALSIRAGVIEDRFIASRRMRVVYSGSSVLCVALGVMLGGLIDAPPELLVVTGGIGVCVGVIGIISVWWRISAHAIMSAYAATLAIAATPWGLPVAVVPVAVSWSRVRLGAHTVWQVTAGSVVGVLIGVLASAATKVF